ncbi:hypothetical protein D0Z00_000119 [Geotrichum galactomycetum]|uniref:Uncharacterized protein n=1 Tax=Geotrichum galactomycetum TaxID=27317 RepID=A0ACB6VAW9_9ASCO|nr:hypothetical protein D0Z00_000119 [Geotrichum candidum]
MPLKEAIRMILDPHVVVEAHKDEATFAPAVDVYKKLQRHGSNAGMPMGRILKSEDINKIVDLLKVGLKENALKYSLDNHLWSHAFIIASSMSPAEWVSSVTEFVREEIREFPSQSSRDLALIYRIFSGAGADAVSEILPGQFATAINEPQVGPHLQASLASWKSTISMMFSNSSPANNEAAKMYSSLLLRAGNVEASHLCDVLFNTGVFGSGAEDAPSFELFGSDPELGAGFGRDIDSILLSLVLEFYKISTEPVLPTIPYYPHLVLYKLQLTSYLADLGSVNEAQNLFDSVSSIVKTAGKNVSYSQPLYKFMDFVSQRLSLTYQDETSSSWLSSKLGRPKLDKMLGQLDKSFSKFVTGEDNTDNANVGDNAYGQQQSSSRRGSIHSPGGSRPASTQPDESLALSPKRKSGGAINPNPKSTSIHLTPTTPGSANSVKRQVAPPPINPYASLNNNPYDPAAQLHEKSPYAPSSATSLSLADKYSPSTSIGSAAKYAPATEQSNVVAENYDNVSFGSIYGYTPANQGSAEPVITEEPETVGDAKVDDIIQEYGEQQQPEEEEPYEEYEAPQYGNSTDEDDDDEGVLDDLPEASDRIFTPMSAPTFTPSPAANSEQDALNGSAIFQENKESKEEAEDFGLSNSAIKPRKPSENTDKEETSNKRSSWFSFFRKSSTSETATQINFGEEMSLVYDPMLKRYVNKNAPKESLKPEPKHAPPPPGPSMTPYQPSSPTLASAATTPPSSGPPRSLSVQPHASSPMAGESPVKPSLTPGPSLTGGLDDLLSSASTPTGHSRKQGKRNARSKYVDIMHQ